jgi:valyl-tRNA synthetase
VWYDLDDESNGIIRIEAGEDEPFDITEGGKRYRYIIGEHAKPIVSLQDPQTLPQYKGKRLLRDPDVLDTWFSSALWPFSTLGWPEKTPELEYYYPTSTLVTSRGIIYFWVARMVMMSEKLLGCEPFSDVVIHGTVLDGEGQVMSKSKGNGVDPLDIIRRYGADAMRFTLADMATAGQDLKFPVQIVCPFCDTEQELPKKRSQPLMACTNCKKQFQQPVPNENPLPDIEMGPLDSQRFEKGRNFSNKVWNASRYVLTNIDALGGVPKLDAAEVEKNLRDEDRWIISRLNSTIKTVTEALDSFEFSRSIGTLYDFFWNEFCSWYIELSKPRLAPGAAAEERQTAQAVLLYTLDRSLRLLHPFCPYVSEALWSELTMRADAAQRNLGRAAAISESSANGGGLLITTQWPQAEAGFIDPEREGHFSSLFESVVAVRAVRQELIDNSPKEKKKEVSALLSAPFDVVIRATDEALATRLRAQAHVLAQMANTKTPKIEKDALPPKPASATAIRGGTVYVALTQDLLEVEKLRLQKEIAKIEQYIPRVEGKLKNENFVKNAPPELVNEERQRLQDAQDKLGSLKAALAALN